MKRIVNRIVLLLVVGALTGVFALAKTIEKEVTFQRSLTVNGTLVKKGTYKVAFNEETGELTIRKGGKILATAPARIEKTNDRKSFYTHSAANDSATVPALVSVVLKDGNLATIVDVGNTRATSSRQ
jgi:hypothetical protein